MFKRGNELMNKIAKTSLGGKWLIIFAFMVLCVGMATTQASAVIQDRIHTFDNNFTMINGLGGQTGGMNDVEFRRRFRQPLQQHKMMRQLIYAS